MGEWTAFKDGLKNIVAVCAVAVPVALALFAIGSLLMLIF
jgi:hypothetical protein